MRSLRRGEAILRRIAFGSRTCKNTDLWVYRMVRHCLSNCNKEAARLRAQKGHMALIHPDDTEPVKIYPLADVPEYSAQLATWYYAEWKRFYGQKTFHDIAQGIRKRAQIDCLPIALVAIHCSQPVGTISLKEYDMDDEREYSPWLAGLYVREDYRKKRIGKDLVAACLDTAKKLHYHKVFLWTPSAAPFFAGLGWSAIAVRTYKGEKITIMERNCRTSTARSS